MTKTRFLKLPVHAAILEVTFTGYAQGNGLIGAINDRQVGDCLPIECDKGIKVERILWIPTPAHLCQRVEAGTNTRA